MNMIEKVKSLAALIAVTIYSVSTVYAQSDLIPEYSSVAAAPSPFSLSSPDFSKNNSLGIINEYNDFGCSGNNALPRLLWENAPEETESFAITVHDPDAPVDGGWWHWVVINLPADENEISVDNGLYQLPNQAKELKNSYKITQYGGPCPPEGHGVHRYNFVVTALDRMLPVELDLSRTEALSLIERHKIAEAKLTLLYERKESVPAEQED